MSTRLMQLLGRMAEGLWDLESDLRRGDRGRRQRSFDRHVRLCGEELEPLVLLSGTSSDPSGSTSDTALVSSLVAGGGAAVATTAPAAPTNLVVANLSSNRVTLSWTDNAANENGFQIYRWSSGTRSWRLVLTVGADVTTGTDTTASAGKSYQYRVRAFNDIGTSSYSNTVSAPTPAVTAPTNLTATVVASTRVDLSWQDNGADEDGFQIDRYSGGSWKKLAQVGTNVTSFSDITAAGGKTYKYRVSAFNTGGKSAYSNTVSVTTPKADTTAPTVTGFSPTNGSLNVATTATASVTFSEAVNGSTISTSTVSLMDGATAVAASVAYNATTRTATLTASAALGNSKTYTILVKGGASGVKDLAGNALAADATSAFTTVAAPDTTPPTVSALSPTSGSSNVATTTAATVTFSEAMTASTVNTSTVLLMDGGVAVTAGVTYNATTRTATLTPTVALANSKTYTIVVKGGASGVKDLAGNALAADVTSSFITAAPANRAPVAVADSYSTNEDTTLTVPANGVLANDSDPDGNPLTTALVTGPSHGTLTLNADGSFTYNPATNYNGADSFTYRASDGAANSSTVTVSLNVVSVNDVPLAVTNSYSTNEDTALTVSSSSGVLANDSDADGDPLTAVLVTGPSHGTLTLNANGSFTYTPVANFSGADSFTYQANDGTANSNTATVLISVGALNDAPVATANSYSTNEDAALTVTAAGGVLANDSDADGNPLTAALVTGPTRGTLALNADGSFTYTPAANYNGADSFTYRANDGTTNSNTATVSLTVVAVNDAPVAVADSYSTNEDAALTVAVSGVLANDSDVDGNPLTAALVAGPTHGTLTLSANGSFAYTPAANYSGADSFTYRASDGTVNSNTVTVSLTVVAVNDAPVAVADGYSTTENIALTVAASGVLTNDSDVEGSPLTAALVAGPTHGTLALNANGSFTYTPTTNYIGSDSFTYRANDGTANSNTVTVSLTVAADTTAPTVSSFSPTAGSTNVATSITATVTFSEAMTASTVNTSTVLLMDGAVAVTAGVSYNASTRTATLTPTAALSNSKTYTIVVKSGANGVKDLAGNVLAADASASFTTVAVASTNLVAAYSFNEGTGTIVGDASGSGNAGALSGATWSTAGRFGNALSFNGTGALVTVADSASLDLTAGMTLEAWVNPSASGATWRDVIYKSSDMYYLEGSSTANMPAAGGTFASGPLYSTSPLSTGVWTHLAATYDGATIRLYVNGTEVASRAQTGAIQTSSGALSIGGDSSFGQFFAGLIDEVRVYKVALTAAQIQTDMNTSIGVAPPDTTPPVTSGVSASAITGSGATIVWTTNEAADTQVEYGTTTSYGSATTLNAALVTSHSATLGGLTASTLYHYRVKSRDAAGNLATSADFTFTTTTPDTTPPVISGVASSGITASGATIAWTTNELADTQVEYGTTTAYGSATTLASSLVTSHSASVGGLAANTLYHFRVKSRDASGNLATSGDFTLTTSAQSSTDPVLPQAYLDTTYAPPVGGQIRTVNAGDNLQNVLNAAQPGDIIVLQAGATFTGNFTIPAKAGSGWIYIQSSAYASLPGPGNRVGPANASAMARIQSPNDQPALLIDKNVRNIRVVGIELTSTFAVQTSIDYGIVGLGYSAGTAAEFPDNIVFDRVYIHGTPTGNFFNGINGSSVGRLGVIDSYISDIHTVGDGSSGIQVFKSFGPVKIDNNHIESADINVFIGDNPDIPDPFIPSDVQITRNYLYKPLSWKVGDPSYAGIHWQVKNLLELKAARRVLIAGNLLENNWADGQDGTAVLFTPRGGPVSDVTFRNNVVRNAVNGFNIIPAWKAMWNILLENNLLYNINYKLLNTAGSGGGPVTNFIIRHNTWVGASNSLMLLEQGNPAIDGFIVYDNIFEHGAYGVIGAGTGWGLPTITTFTVGYDWNNNVLIGAPSPYQTDAKFRGFLYAANDAAVGFQGASLANIADFRLAASSPYKARATDGTDLGADIDAILAAMQAGG